MWILKVVFTNTETMLNPGIEGKTFVEFLTARYVTLTN